MWQRPKMGRLHYTDNVWYDHQRVGHDPLERYMKYLAKEAELSTQIYTNHSIRATCITLLDRAQFESRHIIQITGHRSENTIKQYARKCPPKKKKEMSNVLADILPKAPKLDTPATVTNAQTTTIDTKALSNLTNIQGNTTNNDTPQKHAPNFDLLDMQLLPFDDNDDEELINYLNSNPHLDNPQPQNVSNSVAVQPTSMVNNVQNINAPNMYPNLVPKMFFPNSNVTINYNFK